MLPYIKLPNKSLRVNGQEIFSFLNTSDKNIDWTTVESFGEEWSKFNFFDDQEISQIGNDYFDIVDEVMLNHNSYVLDVGCGTGRWTKYVSGRAGFVEAIDPSQAVASAANLLKNEKNVRITQASVETIPFADNAFDFVFSLGVLHHIPDTFEAMQSCVKKVKIGGFFLVYLYYSLDNRGFLYKLLFQISNLFRVLISKLPQKLKAFVCDLIAFFIYLPFVLISRIVENIAFLKKFIEYIPLSYYRKVSFNVIRNDALDRMGTPLEQRFSKKEINDMLIRAGLTDIQFSHNAPYWHAVGKKN
ncbi:class I SAM-dependent methyltransferase [Adhaeribacter pallidiroseus]|uniref:Malonyl-[acyl-carrier protein] O-methyltransferase n=1 Tax=Adhaeribacter pallidiroseus TaxID=2072847 RepID=A0A369QKD2_9BACT|nr:class I SAM-dependent methyltransferase [Adhaeribacter pallidiroseus]RDC64105.1 Malonyl-[acyl-carrier protein] O-methyltransferase [Adhaeribacter pallidiroseus]